MSNYNEVDAAAFRVAVAPTADALRVFSNAVDAVGPRHGDQPDAASSAMSELAFEANLTAREWGMPITDTHTFGAMTLRASADGARAFAATLDAQHAPLYGHLVVARFALESSVISAWLNEPGIAPIDRIKRGLCEQLYSAREVERLRLGESSRPMWEQAAASFGWQLQWNAGKPVLEGTARPRVGDGITELLGRGGDAQIGRLLWSRLSAVTHTTWWGIQWALLHSTGDVDVAGMTTVAVGTDSSQVATQAFYVAEALLAAAESRFTLMNWSDDQWKTACQQLEMWKVELLRTLAQRAADEQAGASRP